MATMVEWIGSGRDALGSAAAGAGVLDGGEPLLTSEGRDWIGPLWSELQSLALPESPLLESAGQLVITEHAVKRYRQRVEHVPRCRARRRLARLAETARWEVLPRHWSRLAIQDGTSYGFPEGRPDVCLLMRNHHVVTVLSQRYLREQDVAYDRARARARSRDRVRHRLRQAVGGRP